MTLQPEAHEVRDVSVKQYYEAYWRRATPPPVGDPLAQTRLRLLQDCMTAADAESVLEVGCGAGELVGALAADGITATGIDISDAAVARASQAYPVCSFVQHQVEDRPWPVAADAFDVVATFEVIEHLLRPRELLLGARTALRDGGHIAITTPYHGAMKSVAMALRGFDQHFAVEGEHIRFFSDRALLRLLDETGFETQRVSHFGRVWPVWSGVFIWAKKR